MNIGKGQRAYASLRGQAGRKQMRASSPSCKGTLLARDHGRLYFGGRQQRSGPTINTPKEHTQYKLTRTRYGVAFQHHVQNFQPLKYQTKPALVLKVNNYNAKVPYPSRRFTSKPSTRDLDHDMMTTAVYLPPLLELIDSRTHSRSA